MSGCLRGEVERLHGGHFSEEGLRGGGQAQRLPPVPEQLAARDYGSIGLHRDRQDWEILHSDKAYSD